MEGLDHLTTITDPLLVCCLCKRLLQEAVQMKCLHNCCRHCFCTLVSKGSSRGVACGSCGTVTQAGRAQPNGFIDSQVLRYKSIAVSRVCGKCRENGEYGKPALLWCPTCRHSLCGDCDVGHRQYFRQHVTLSLKELKSSDDVCSHASPTSCTIHKRPTNIACLTCEQTKCASCWAECNAKQHEMRVVGEESFDSYVSNFVQNQIVSMESELLLKSKALEKPKCVLRDTKAALDRHLEELNKRKRRVVEAVEMVYQEMEYSLKCACEDVEAESAAAAAAADRITSELSDTRNYICRLLESNDKCEMFNQRKNVRERLSFVSAEVGSLSDRMATMRTEVKIEASRPDDLEELVQAWARRPLVFSVVAGVRTKQEARMEDVDNNATITDPLLSCCLCRCLLQEAVQLTCLHNCCRHCFSTAASKGSSQDVGCALCGTVTQPGGEQPNRFIDSQVQRYKSIADSRACGVCRCNGEYDKPALVWCSACRHSLCEDCVAAHRQYFRQHATRSLDELGSLVEVYSHASPSSCPIHKKPVDIACLNCQHAMCISCWAECKEKKHEMYIVGKEAFDNYVGKCIASISTLESELLLKSDVLEKPARILWETRAARDRHLEELNKRALRVADAVKMVHQRIELSTKNAYDDLEAEGDAFAAAADRIASASLDARSYIRRLVESNEKCELLSQQRIVQQRLRVLSSDLDSLGDRLDVPRREIKVEASLPLDMEDVLGAWIGMPLVYSAALSPPPHPAHPHMPPPHQQPKQPQQQEQQQKQQQEQQQEQQQKQQQKQQEQQHFSFGDTSASLQLPVHCWDVALAKDGSSLLLAAGQHGLLEFSSSFGRELHRWLPPKLSTDPDDKVLAVATLCDGRAAVSLLEAKLVVLLRREETKYSGGEASAVAGNLWTEDDRLDLLPWPAEWLSAHGDVLAASELLGPGLQLLSLSSRQRLSKAGLQREYMIGRLAVAASVVITGSKDRVELGGGRRAAHVLDAHRLAGGGDERLWRYALGSSDEEQLWGVCSDSSGGCLYAAVCRSGWSSGRVSALSLADGSELRRVALSFESAAAPVQLSLSSDGLVAAAHQQSNSSSSSNGRVVLLAALCWNRTTVNVHRSTADVLQ